MPISTSLADHVKLLLKPREAAAILSISERQLWQYTSPRGPITATRIGNCVRYSRDALQAYIREQERKVPMMHDDAKPIVDDIVRLYQNGDSVAQIAEKLHLLEPAVRHALDHGRLPESQPLWLPTE
jgi:hypothetical protein